jgi:hypothetical protein
MGRRGDGYGSEDHLLRYMERCRDRFDAAVADVLGIPPASIRWLPRPTNENGEEREFRELEFLGDEWKSVKDAWRDKWPRRGTPICWDAVGKADSGWLLVEAKANHPEFCSPPSGATGESLKLITKTLNQTKKYLGVHRHEVVP